MIRYKLVRRGQKYCVRVQGVINTTEAFGWCRERKMEYRIKQHWNKVKPWLLSTQNQVHWDYDFIFDKEYEATAFMIGFL